MLFISPMFAVSAFIMCFLVSIYSIEDVFAAEKRVPSVNKVVIMNKEMVFNEVDMNGTRYAFADDRKVEETGDQWKTLYITPVNNQKTNLRQVYDEDSIQREFIKEAFARCIGNISWLQSSDETWVATFDHWYDNRFTGVIRYFLIKNGSRVNEPSTMLINIVDEDNKSNMYRLSIFPPTETEVGDATQIPTPRNTNLRGRI